MRAELHFNSVVLTDEDRLHYLSPIVIVERDGTNVTFKPNRDGLKLLDQELTKAGIDNANLRNAVLTFKVLAATGELINTLAGNLADRFLIKTVKEEKVDAAKYLELIAKYFTKTTSEDV